MMVLMYQGRFDFAFFFAVFFFADLPLEATVLLLGPGIRHPCVTHRDQRDTLRSRSCPQDGYSGNDSAPSTAGMKMSSVTIESME